MDASLQTKACFMAKALRLECTSVADEDMEKHGLTGISLEGTFSRRHGIAFTHLSIIMKTSTNEADSWERFCIALLGPIASVGEENRLVEDLSM